MSVVMHAAGEGSAPGDASVQAAAPARERFGLRSLIGPARSAGAKFKKFGASADPPAAGNKKLECLSAVSCILKGEHPLYYSIQFGSPSLPPSPPLHIGVFVTGTP